MLLKLNTSAGVFKDLFKLDQITGASQANGSGFELGAFSSVDAAGRYSKEERDNFTNFLNTLVGSLHSSTAHPNAGAFSFKNPTWYKRIEALSGSVANTSITSNTDIDGVYRASRTEVTWRDSSGDYTAPSSETLPTVDFQVNSTSSNNKVDITPVGAGSNSLRESTELVSVRTNSGVTLSKQSGTGPNTITKGSAASANMALNISNYSYGIQNLGVNVPGKGFANTSGARFDFPVPKNPALVAANRTRASVSFTTVADKNYTFTVGYAAKTVQVKYSAYFLDQLFKQWLNNKGNFTPDGFVELQEQYA